MSTPAPSQLRADTIEELRQRVKDEFGPKARIVSAERITGGFGPFKKAPYYEAVVEVPADTPVFAEPSTADRIGIAALLADADAAEDQLAAADAGDFDGLMQSLDGFTGDTRPAAVQLEVIDAPTASTPVLTAPAPTPPTTPGDLVAVVGFGPDVLQVAQGMAKHYGPAETRGAGTIKARGKESLTDRRSAFLARAEGVERGKVIYCAVGLEYGTDLTELVTSLGADQVWVVVDAGRKPEDTADWVNQVGATAGVSAVAVVGAATTKTPQTVNTLGFPVGWSNGSPTPGSTL